MMSAGNYDFTLVRGASWTPQFKFYKDNAQTQVFDLTGYTVEVKFSDGTILSSVNNEVTVDAPNGMAQPQLLDSSSLDTKAFELGWSLKLIDASGRAFYPVMGKAYLSNPPA